MVNLSAFRQGSPGSPGWSDGGIPSMATVKAYENQWKTYGKAMKTYENEWLNPPSPKNSWQLIYCH